MRHVVRLYMVMIVMTGFAGCARADTHSQGNAACVPAGCSGQLCVPAKKAPFMATTCGWKQEYGCYEQFGTCEMQSTGECGWTASPAFAACMAAPEAYVTESGALKTHDGVRQFDTRAPSLRHAIENDKDGM